MPTTCPECGAVLNGGATCQEIFDSFLVLEFTDPEYGTVHFLTVACFMIQHGRYSDEGFLWIQQKLHAYLEDGLTSDLIRRLAAQDTGNQDRTWKVTRSASEPQLPRIPWTMTIADVAAGYEEAATSAEATSASAAARYRELIEQWGRVTLREMKPLLSGSKGPG